MPDLALTSDTRQVLRTGVTYQNYDPYVAVIGNGLGAPNAGQERLHAIYLPKGAVVTTITYCSGSTALITSGTGSHCWAALHDASRNLLGQSADDTAATWAANALKTFTLVSPYTIPSSGLYYLGLMVHAGGTGTQPTLSGKTDSNSVLAGLAPILGGNSSSSSLTTTAPNPAGAITVLGGLAWCGVA